MPTEIMSCAGCKQPLSQLQETAHRLVPSGVRGIHQRAQVKVLVITSEFLKQAILQLNGNLLQRYNGQSVSIFECLSKASNAPLLLFLDFAWRLVDALF
jgi:hypothetical protein